MIEYLGLGLLLSSLAILLAALVLVRRTMRDPIQRITEWMRRARSGEPAQAADLLPKHGLLAPLAKEAKTLARNLSLAQETAEVEAKLRELADSLWTAEKLREHVKVKLHGRPLVVIANREPYRHVRRGRAVECLMPASGLVTGLEPLLRACGGTWVAQGDGDADRQTADAQGRLKVPPDSPQYCLRRVWLSPEEEKGYYLGFANEGLWPLCHIAHERPVFRPEDWAFYRQVNMKFASAVLEEIEGLDEPFLLIQDYHFTLLPRLLKERRPDARIALFWHIPWPNPEAFAICPWQKDLLDGMLGADVIGFHTQFHCNNFLETVDRTLESRIDRERFAIKRAGHATVVKPFPISVDFTESGRAAGADPRAEREKILKSVGGKARYLAVGVDRLDYTKGILERIRGVERFLEKYPAYQGQFTLIQIGAPSRTTIPSYRNFVLEIEAQAKRINARFPAKGSPPIVLLIRHHSHAEIRPFYRAADLCMVTSLHDGMNLVAKEFIVSREDEKGALILSRFTGAARQLRDALIVNPYDTDEVAEAIHAALTMSPEQQALRMMRLRNGVREHNIYRWASDLITELASIRIEAVPTASP